MKLFITVLFCLSTLAIFAQPKQNSPYSRYGLGDPFPQYFAQQAAMGGLTTANHDPFHLNLTNPASFGYLRATAFETGLYAKNSSFKSNTSNLNSWSGNLTHFALGFTLKSPVNEALDRKKSPWKYGMGFGITPYSLVGYNIATLANPPDLGIVSNEFEGKGGIYQLTWGAAAKYKNTSFGGKLGWVFGKSAYENTTTFRDSIQASSIHYQNNFREELLINGLTWKLGVMHDFNLKFDPNNKELATEWITAGLTFNANHKLNGTGNTLKIRSRGRNSNGTYASPDTLVYLPDQNADVTLPATVSLGLTYVKANKLKLGVQYDYAAWSNYENNIRPFKMRNTSSIAAGLEYIPNFSSYNKALARVRYRVGAYYRQDSRIINNENVDDLGISFGFGLPVILPRQGTSFVNTSFELGKIGGGTSVEEAYFRINLGFTLNDNSWFYKRRFE